MDKINDEQRLTNVKRRQNSTRTNILSLGNDPLKLTSVMMPDIAQFGNSAMVAQQILAKTEAHTRYGRDPSIKTNFMSPNSN